MDERTLQLLQRLRLSNLQLTAAVRNRLESELLRAWRAMDSWSDADMARLLNDLLPMVEAAERRTVDITASYLGAVEAAVAGAAFRPSTPDYKKLTGAALRGVDPDVVFMRPQMVLNWNLSKGGSLTKAVKAGERRLLSLGATNVQLAKTHTVAALGKAKFYRRVLTGSENCALCVIASTQRYRRGDLAPIHPGCDCAVEPLVDAQPPHVIDPDLLDQTHQAIIGKVGFTDRSARGLDHGKFDQTELSDFTDLIVTRHHGELGPVLAWRDDHFRGPAEAAGLAS